MNKKVKKYKLLFLVSFLLFFAVFVFAQDLEVTYPTIPGAPLPAEPTLPEYIKYIYNFALIIAGLIAFFSLIYGGFRYVLSVGQPVAMSDAKDQITAGIVGLIILLGSYLFLVAVNPELTILRIGPLDLALECSVDTDCYEGQECKGGVCMVPIKPLQLTAKVYRLYEIPIGKLIEKVLEPNRLNRLNGSAQRIKNLSAQISDKTVQFEEIINNPCNLCSSTNPDPDECGEDVYYWCFSSADQCDVFKPPDKTCNSRIEEVVDDFIVWEWCWGEDTLFCPSVVCTGDPCSEEKRNEALELKEDIRNLAADLAAKMEAILPDLTSFRKDNQRLEIGMIIIRETIYPINYDNMLEMKQIILELGGDVEIVPFTFLNETIRGEGDPATFYTDEEQVRELIASGDWPSFPTLDTLAVCDECQIDLGFTGFDIPESVKEEFAATYAGSAIKDPCLGGLDCWDYVISQAKQNGWNPAFVLSIWGAESSFSADTVALGCDIHRINDGTSPYTGDIVSQLECFFDTVDPISGNCRIGNQCSPNNTDFCAFARCWTSGPSQCTLSNDSTWFPNALDIYTRLLPDAHRGDNQAYPTGNCTATPPDVPPTGDPLPPGLAGCPLNPETGFDFNGGWHAYCKPTYSHDGVDLGAPRGTPVYAIGVGVAFAKTGQGYGTWVALQVSGIPGIFAYAHLTTTSHQNAGIPIEGIPVMKGDLIGFIDDTGISFGDHLHFAYYPGGIAFVGAVPIECLGIDCIPVTTATNFCTDGSLVCQ